MMACSHSSMELIRLAGTRPDPTATAIAIIKTLKMTMPVMSFRGRFAFHPSLRRPLPLTNSLPTRNNPNCPFL